MKHTKRLLALLLTLALALGLAAPAFAEDAVVTHITAQWNGKVIIRGSLEPLFTPDNLVITRHYSDGTSDDTLAWDLLPPKWQLAFTYDRETGMETVKYMQQFEASFAFPANYIELYVDSFQPLQALTLDKPAALAQGGAVYTFTPERSGEHWFIPSGNNLSFLVLDANFNRPEDYVQVSNRSYEGIAKLTAGETYYVLAWPSYPNQTIQATRPSALRLIGQKMLWAAVMPFMFTNGPLVLILPVYMLLLPIVFPLGIILSIALLPISLPVGFIWGLVDILT